MTKARTSWLYMLLLGLAIVAAYAGVAGNDFVVLDDRAWIVRNERVQAGLTPEGVEWAFETRFGGAWQPLVWMSWMVDRSLFGPEPRGFHLANLSLHLLASLLLFSSLRRLFGNAELALLVAGLYALHPVQVESVAWAAERKGLLAAFFWMLAMEAYSRHERSPHRAWRAAIFASMLLGLMAKSTLLVLPFALLLLDVWPRQTLRLRRGWGPMLREKVELFLLVPLFLVIGFRAQEGFGAVRDAGLVERAGAVAVAYLRSLAHLFAPFELGPMYAAPPGGFSPLAIVAAVLVLLAVTLVLHRVRCALPAPWIGWVWFVVTLLPFSGIVAVGGHFMADRYLLIPSIGIWTGLAYSLKAVLDGRQVPGRARWIAACVVFVLLGAATSRQVGKWEDSTTLFAHALHVNPDNSIAEYWLGEARADEGDVAAAARHFAGARATNPNYDLAWFQEGSALVQLGRLPEAARSFERYLELRPRQFKGWMNLGATYGRMGRHEEALRCFERAVEIAPGHPQALANRDRARELAGSRGE